MDDGGGCHEQVYDAVLQFLEEFFHNFSFWVFGCWILYFCGMFSLNGIMDDNQLLEQNEVLKQQHSDLQKEFWKEKTKWLRFLVTTMSIVLGILISVGPDYKSPLHIGICFVIGVFLLTLGILFLSVCLYSGIHYKSRGIVLFEEEAKKAIQERRRAQSVKVQPRAIFSISEVCGYICFVLALLALCAYMFLRLL